MGKMPLTVEQILATGVMNPEFEAAWKAAGAPPGDLPSDPAAFQKAVFETLPAFRQDLEATRPAGVVETEHSIPIDDTFSSRVVICRPASPDTRPSPIVILIHGGAHCVGYPEMEVVTARLLVLAYNATCILPSYRLVPEYTYPTNVKDILAVVKYVAEESTKTSSDMLPKIADPKAGFILGGLSAGAAISSHVAQLVRNENLRPPLTGAFLTCGVFINPECVPDRYKEQYLSMEQNKDAPTLNKRSLLRIMKDYDGGKTGRLSNAYSFDQHHPEGIAAGHKNLPPIYFQAAGLDPARDDTIIYERVLREEVGIPTRIDVYSGFPHGFWTVYKELEATKIWKQDTVDGFGWLLGVHQN
ncbi:alpha/beta-hydrolase [Thozetella sp. PMI_491]|nr:alpha/beta-hydrolase [Thozetella sp. PMI_491]